MQKEKIGTSRCEEIVQEFVSLGGAFVEDDFQEDEVGCEIYNPHVDRATAEQWLREKLNGVS